MDKRFMQRLQNALRSSYGYVKAHEYQGLTKALLAEIEELIPEVSIQVTQDSPLDVRSHQVVGGDGGADEPLSRETGTSGDSPHASTNSTTSKAGKEMTNRERAFKLLHEYRVGETSRASEWADLVNDVEQALNDVEREWKQEAPAATQRSQILDEIISICRATNENAHPTLDGWRRPSPRV